MKQRITYLLRNAYDQGGVDPSTLEVKSDSLKIPGLDSAKEWRITAGAKELPLEIWEVLKSSHELHLRWTSPELFDLIPPLVSRTPPGLHASFTPTKDSMQDALCPLLTRVFGPDLPCHSVKESFTAPSMVSERFAMSASFQYYQPLSNLQHLIEYLQQEVCAAQNIECRKQIADLTWASSIDFDFDVISHALKVNAVWAHGPGGGRWEETIRLQSQSDSIEVGVLNAEKATEPEELSLGGFLTVLGEDTKPSATLFSFPSRHHPLPQQDSTTFKTLFRQPTGLHPTLELTFPAGSLTPPVASCALHAYLTLPSTVFIDRYQLSDPIFLSSQNLVSLRSLSGEADLEAPVWVLKKWGSASLFELKTPTDYYDSGSTVSDDAWNISIPLHLRYLPPSGANETTPQPGKRETEIPWPAVFWACEAEEGLKMSVNPFDRVNLGYDGLFGPKTMFYHVPPAPAAGGNLVEKLEAPVLDLEKTQYVEYGTALAVVLGFAWVCWKLLGTTTGGQRVKIQEDKKRA